MLFQHKKRFIGGFLLAILSVFAISCGSAEKVAVNSNSANSTPVTKVAEPKATGETAQITIEKYAFGPVQLSIKAGTKVVWTNKDSVAHTATSDEKKFDTGLIAQNKEASYVFETPGTYAYHCTPHPQMKAQIIVTK